MLLGRDDDDDEDTAVTPVALPSTPNLLGPDKGHKIPEGEIRMVQIAAAPFTSPTGQSYSVLGLGIDGVVYRYDPKCKGWIPWPMAIATCGHNHLAGR